MKPAMTAQQARYSSARSPLALYREHAVGDVGWAALLYYEASQLFFSNLPGVLGFALRALFYPALFRESEGRPAIGRSVVLRNPKKISLGRGCLLDDFAVLDARGAAVDELQPAVETLGQQIGEINQQVAQVRSATEVFQKFLDGLRQLLTP